jgi:single-strand DNA-binding protein
MASFNRVILMGNLTRDPELRYLQSGMAVTDIGLAVNDRKKTPNGEWVDDPVFVDITLWGRTAEVVSEYCSKGKPLFVEGRLKLDTWESEGQKKSKLKVTGDRIQLLGTKEGGSSAGEGGYRQAAPRQQQQSQGGYQGGGGYDSYDPPSPDDDVPF